MNKKFTERVSGNKKTREDIKDLSQKVMDVIGTIMELPRDQMYNKLESLYKLNYSYHVAARSIYLQNPPPDVITLLESTKKMIDDFRYDIKSLSQYVMNENNNAL